LFIPHHVLLNYFSFNLTAKVNSQGLIKKKKEEENFNFNQPRSV